MPLIWHNEPFWEYDATAILVHIHSGDTISKYKEMQLQKIKNKNSEKEISTLLDNTIYLEQEASTLFSQDEISKILYENHENASPLAMVLLNENNEDISMENAIYSFFSDDNIKKIDFDINDSSHFFSFINSLDEFTKEEKYNILDFYFNFDKFKNYHNNLLAKIIPLIKNNVFLFKKLLADLDAEVKSLIDEKGYDFLKDYVYIELNKDEDIYVYPTLSSPNAISLSDYKYNNSSSSGSGKFNVYIGYSIFKLINLSNDNKKNMQYDADFFKILADPTKMSILRILKEKALYSGQIAKELNLSNATISHHMNTLCNSKIVTLRKDGARVYYSRNEDIIKNYIDNLSEYI